MGLLKRNNAPYDTFLFRSAARPSYAIFVATQAPILSLMQLSLDASERAFGVALALFFNNLIGQALNAAAIGAMSYAFKPQLGAASLNLAVFIVCAGSGVAALGIFAWTARQIRLAA